MPLSPLQSHFQLLSCLVTCLFKLSKYVTFKQIERVCHSIYCPIATILTLFCNGHFYLLQTARFIMNIEYYEKKL